VGAASAGADAASVSDAKTAHGARLLKKTIAGHTPRRNFMVGQRLY
jgi:hypothetical protein